MLQVFHLIIVKVDRDVSYVAMPIQRIFQVFHLFQTNVANILSGYFKSRLGCCTVLVADKQRPAAAAFCWWWWSAVVGQRTWIPHASGGWA
jgi:hypothetical protein